MRGHIRVRKGSRGTSYELRVYTGSDENGRRQYLVETVRGTRRDAEKRLTQILAAVDAGQAGTTSKARLSELVDAWWETSTGHLSPHTRIGYRGMLKRYVLPAFGSRRIDKIKPLELERWYARLIESPPPLSPLTVRKVHTMLSGILSTAVRWGWLSVSPLARVRAPRAVLKTMRAPEPEEVALALKAAEEFDEQLHVFLRLSAALGTRRGETAALHWCDINFENGDVHVHRALAPVESDPKQVLEKGRRPTRMLGSRSTKRQSRSSNGSVFDRSRRRSPSASRSTTTRTSSRRTPAADSPGIRTTSGSSGSGYDEGSASIRSASTTSGTSTAPSSPPPACR